MKQKRTLVIGPIFTQSGYGEHTRFVVNSLMNRSEEFDVHINAIKWASSDWVFDDSPEGTFYKTAANKYAAATQQKSTHFDLVVCVSIPTEWGPYFLNRKINKEVIDNVTADVFVGVTAGMETDYAPLSFYGAVEEADVVIVPSLHAKKSLDNLKPTFRTSFTFEDIERKGTSTPISVIPYPFVDIEPEDMGLQFDNEFNFLTVAQFGPRKDLESLVRWFCEEFKNDDVGLVIKTHVVNDSIHDLHQLKRGLQEFLKTHNLEDKKCKIHIVHGSLTKGEMSYLYNHPQIKSFVTTTHGEGFGLPIYEAACNGLPVIATGWSGHVDFLTTLKKNKKDREEFYDRISYDLTPMAEEMVNLLPDICEKEMKWATCREKKVKKLLRSSFKHIGGKEKRAALLQENLRESHDASILYQKMVDSINMAFENKEALKAWVENKKQIRIFK